MFIVVGFEDFQRCFDGLFGCFEVCTFVMTGLGWSSVVFFGQFSEENPLKRSRILKSERTSKMQYKHETITTAKNC